MLDLRGLLTSQGIDFVESGPNVSSNSIGLACPLCNDDPSHHVNLSMEEDTLGWWLCWRDQSHRGRKPDFLLHKLLNKSRKQVEMLLLEWGMEQAGRTDIAMFSKLNPVKMFQRPQFVPLMPDFKVPTWPKVFQPVTREAGRFYDYLEHDRKFGSLALAAADYYSLYYAESGDWADRIIIPVFLERRVATWTARAIGKSFIRYRTLPTKESTSIKTLLFNQDNLKGNVLILCEGPFDAMKLDLLGARMGIRATCVFGNNVSQAQLYALSYVTHFFQRVVFGWDSKSLADRTILMRLMDELRVLGKTSTRPFITLPDGVQDPGDLSIKQAYDVLKSVER